MNKEEILAQSRKENKGMDLAAIDAYNAGVQEGWYVLVVLSIVIAVVDWFFFGRILSEVMFAVYAGQAVARFCQYAKQQQRRDLTVAILCSLCSVCGLIVWIIEIVER